MIFSIRLICLAKFKSELSVIVTRSPSAEQYKVTLKLSHHKLLFSPSRISYAITIASARLHKYYQCHELTSCTYFFKSALLLFYCAVPHVCNRSHVLDRVTVAIVRVTIIVYQSVVFFHASFITGKVIIISFSTTSLWSLAVTSVIAVAALISSQTCGNYKIFEGSLDFISCFSDRCPCAILLTGHYMFMLD